MSDIRLVKTSLKPIYLQNCIGYLTKTESIFLKRFPLIYAIIIKIQIATSKWINEIT